VAIFVPQNFKHTLQRFVEVIAKKTEKHGKFRSFCFLLVCSEQEKALTVENVVFVCVPRRLRKIFLQRGFLHCTIFC
jgi:hypothetical protein